MKLFQKLFSREDTKSALDTRKAIAFVDYERKVQHRKDIHIWGFFQ